MPTYEYFCDNHHRYSETRSINEKQRVFECPECGLNLKRIFEPTPAQFRGTGFYKTGG